MGRGPKCPSSWVPRLCLARCWITQCVLRRCISGPDGTEAANSELKKCCVSVCMCACVFACVHIGLCELYVHVCTCMCANVFVCAHVYIVCVCAYVCVCVCTHVCRVLGLFLRPQPHPLELPSAGRPWVGHLTPLRLSLSLCTGRVAVVPTS